MDEKIRNWNHKRIDLSRALELKLFIWICTPLNRMYKTNEENLPILVLRLDDKVGDSVTATGFLRELKKTHTKQKLIVLAGLRAASVYHHLDFIDEILICQKGFISTLKVYFKLKQKKFDLIINTSHILSPRVVYLVSQLSARRKLAFLNTDVKIFTEHVVYNQDTDHVSDRYRASLAKILNKNISQVTDLHYEVFLSTEQKKWAQEQLAQVNSSHLKLVILNSFAGARLRNLSRERTFAIVATLLQNEDLIILSIGNDGDLKIISGWVKDFNHPRWIYIPESGSLQNNLALVNSADVMITPDTAWVHLASALKKKLVAIYREDSSSEKNALIWAPYQTPAKMIYAPYRAGEVPDINSVNVEELCKAVLDFLK